MATVMNRDLSSSMISGLAIHHQMNSQWAALFDSTGYNFRSVIENLLKSAGFWNPPRIVSNNARISRQLTRR